MPGQMPGSGMQEMYSRGPSSGMGMGPRPQYSYNPGFERRQARTHWFLFIQFIRRKQKYVNDYFMFTGQTMSWVQRGELQLLELRTTWCLPAAIPACSQAVDTPLIRGQNQLLLASVHKCLRCVELQYSISCFTADTAMMDMGSSTRTACHTVHMGCIRNSRSALKCHLSFWFHFILMMFHAGGMTCLTFLGNSCRHIGFVILHQQRLLFCSESIRLFFIVMLKTMLN